MKGVKIGGGVAGKNESQNVEYMRNWHDEYLKGVCGFANAKGGTIWIGIYDDTRVHSDYCVIGSEFCDFLATVLTWRLIKAFTAAKLLDDLTYRRIMKNLKRAKKAKVSDGQWQLIKSHPLVKKMLGALGLVALDGSTANGDDVA